MPVSRLSILGLGLIGGSIGLAVKRGLTGCKVSGYDASPTAAGIAFDLKAIDVRCESIHEAVSESDLVILAVPVRSIPGLMHAIVPFLKDDAFVTDVGSTKRSIIAIAEEVLPGRFVGSHPMAGGERSGISAARADLFEGATCILTPPKSSENSTSDPLNNHLISTLELFWKSLGARTRLLSPDDHDRLVAAASHLPHAVAAMLVAVGMIRRGK